ncbi:MAG TPA: FkbM family methyltransferase [Magnetospirillaceae bacterium]|jgi:FkbM family methyltransferase
MPIGTRLRIGLAWAGPTIEGTAIDFQAVLPITGVAGVAVFSLQKGPRAADLADHAHPALIRDLSSQMTGDAATAAVLTQLDLIISADAGLAMRAAKLGRPVWILLPPAADAAGIVGRDGTPTLSNIHVFRQARGRDWRPVIEAVAAGLEQDARSRPAFGLDGECGFASVFLNDDKTPRFTMSVPHLMFRDKGAEFLAARERGGIGYEFASRCWIDAHLAPGDVFIDVGAHWGIMSLQAATRWPGQVNVLAVEPSAFNVAKLRDWIARNDLGNAIEVVMAAAGAAAGRGRLTANTTMGHSINIAAEGDVSVVSIDGLLRARPHLAGRKAVIKIDVEGGEPEVVAGMAQLLASGVVKAVIWERGDTYSEPGGTDRVATLRKNFADRGFTAWRFESENEGGRLVPFVEDGRFCNVFELGPGLEPKPFYDSVRIEPGRQPHDPVADAVSAARTHCDAGHQALGDGRIDEAFTRYADAAALDLGLDELYLNLGVALRQAGRLAAAEAAYRVSLGLRDTEAARHNLTNLLRQRGGDIDRGRRAGV